MTKFYTYEIVSTAIGGQSLIGTGKERPVSWGNYFWLADGPRVLNFWSENLTSADKKFNLGGKVRIRRYKIDKIDVCIIDDKRIPENWYYNKLCFTGGGGINSTIAEDIYKYLGDPTFELEQFTDPVSYYEKRGSTYDPKTGIIKTSVIATPRPLLKDWIVKEVQDLDVSENSFSFDIENEMAQVLMAEIAIDEIKSTPQQKENSYFYASWIPIYKVTESGIAIPEIEDDRKDDAIKFLCPTTYRTHDLLTLIKNMSEQELCDSIIAGKKINDAFSKSLWAQQQLFRRDALEKTVEWVLTNLEN